ncbi:MAG TPA: hypothetical protein VM261_06525 [Kofleriaceae bacterium]|nr:hypothetical protein [Kofleriaceae bacterium]
MSGREPSHTQAHTHRDTFAFVLAMGGMTMWALFPAIALVHGNSRDDEQSILALGLFVGCLIGAGVGAGVFRGAALATVTVAGALTSALSIGCVSYVEHRTMPALGGFTVSTVLLTTIAAVAGAVLGKRVAPRPSVAAAAIVLGALGATIALLGLVDPVESSTAFYLLLALLFASPLLGATIAALVCDGVRPGAVMLWTFALLASTFVILFFTMSEGEGRGNALLGGFFISGVTGACVAVPTIVVNALRRRRVAATAPVVPTAQVVDR